MTDPNQNAEQAAVDTGLDAQTPTTKVGLGATMKAAFVAAGLFGSIGIAGLGALVAAHTTTLGVALPGGLVKGVNGAPAAATGLLGPFTGDVTPLNYNAKGDGVTDDTTAVQAALNAEPNVTLPGGTTFAISNTLFIPAGHALIGHPGSSLKLIARLLANIVTCTSGANVTVAGVTINGNGLQQGGDAILFAACPHGNIRNNHVIDANGGIGVTELTSGSLLGSHDSLILGNVVENVVEHAFYVSISPNTRVVGNRAVGFGDTGVNVQASTDVVVSGNSFDGNDVNLASGYGCIRATNLSHRLVVVGNAVRRCSRGIFILESDDVVASGNIVEDTGAQGVLVNAGGTSATRTLSNARISNNIVRNPGRFAPTEGIRIAQATPTNTVQNVVVSDNTIIATRSQPDITGRPVPSQGTMTAAILDTTGNANFIYANTCPASMPCSSNGGASIGGGVQMSKLAAIPPTGPGAGRYAEYIVPSNLTSPPGPTGACSKIAMAGTSANYTIIAPNVGGGC